MYGSVLLEGGLSFEGCGASSPIDICCVLVRFYRCM